MKIVIATDHNGVEEKKKIYSNRILQHLDLTKYGLAILHTLT